MKVISKKLALLALVTGVLIVGTGCAQQQELPPGMSAEDVIMAGFENAENVTKAIFEVELSGNLSGDGNKLNGMVGLDGTFDEDAEKMLLAVNIDGTMNEESVDGSLELRLNNDGVFLNINVNLSDETSQALIEEIVGDYMNKWVKLAFVKADDVFEASEENPFKSISQGEDFNPFKDIEYQGTQNILGVNSYHFTASLDEEKVIEQMKKESTYDPDIEQAFEAMEFNGDVYVSVDGLVLTGIGGQAKFSDPELTGTVDFSYSINPTTSGDVETPSYEEEITEEDVGALFPPIDPFGTPSTPLLPEGTVLDEEVLDEQALMELEEAMKEFEALE